MKAFPNVKIIQEEMFIVYIELLAVKDYFIIKQYIIFAITDAVFTCELSIKPMGNKAPI